MKVHLRTLGCRLNQSEIDTMARQFRQQGHDIVEDPALADWMVVNTCAVTHDATRSSRHLVRDLHRANERAQITVTGCYAQLSPDDIKVIPGVARVVGNLDKDTLVEKITGVPIEPFDREPLERGALPGASGRTRAFVKVQDGCDNACTFCVTTIARGAGRSRSLPEVVDEIRYLHTIGYQEAVLTGVHLGSYGHDLGDPQGLFHLVRAILADTDIPRLRLSSLEPWDLSSDCFDLWENPRLCPHLHLPLQSGCDATLKRMLRRTNQISFSALVGSARQRIPNVSITTDVIVGFPGETDDEFAISAAFIEQMEFAGMHVFRYSKRPGTAAARMRGQVNESIKKERSARLIALAQQAERRFAERFIGQTLSVLWEQIAGATEAGFVNVGYTGNYIRVRCIHPRILTNHIIPARLDSYTDGQMRVTPEWAQILNLLPQRRGRGANVIGATMDDPRPKLQVALKEAIVNRDNTRRDVIRMSLNALKQVEIDTQKQLSAEEALAILQKEAKKRRESVEEAEKAGRAEVAAREKLEVGILEEFLPKQLSREEIAALARDAIAQSGATSANDMGKVMGVLMPKVKGVADGKLVNQVVRELLSG